MPTKVSVSRPTSIDATAKATDHRRWPLPVLLSGEGVAFEETVRCWPVDSDRNRVWNAAQSREYTVVFRDPIECPGYAYRKGYLSTIYTNNYPHTYAKPDAYPHTYADEGRDNRAAHRSRVRQTRRGSDCLLR
jgi:hypothetical protein